MQTVIHQMKTLMHLKENVIILLHSKSSKKSFPKIHMKIHKILKNSKYECLKKGMTFFFSPDILKWNRISTFNNIYLVLKITLCDSDVFLDTQNLF